jgi:uracil DNA glycosylase
MPAYAFLLPPVPQVRVVILGQDPYINQGEAMGLCFSVPPSACGTRELCRNLAQVHKDVLACMQLVPGSGAILQAGTDPSCQHAGFFVWIILSTTCAM